MVDHVGDQLAGGGLGLDARDELTARRAHHLDPDLRKALVELLDDLLFDFGEIRGVIDQFAFRLRRRDQFGRTEFLRPRRWRAERDAESGDGGERDDPGSEFFVHGQSSLYLILCPTLPCPAPLPSPFAPPMRTPHRTVCTRLNAAVFPRFPPS